VPRLVGLSLPEARATLRGADLGLVRRFYNFGGEFQYGVRRVPSEESPGTVLEQSPPPGVRVRPGKDIRLVVAAPEPAPCDPSYPTLCIPPGVSDLDCDQVNASNFTVRPPDPHGFDGNDNDGVGCET
jgi:beta-lactam-binding protein with PASTA domain